VLFDPIYDLDADVLVYLVYLSEIFVCLEDIVRFKAPFRLI